MRSATVVVAASVEPSVVRTLISNCDWSSTGRKFLPTSMNSGTMLRITKPHSPIIIQRCPSDQCSSHV